MSDDGLSPKAFYTEQVPTQWNRVLDVQEQAVEEARRVLDDMRAVEITIRVDVQDAQGGTFFLNVRDGRMVAEDEPAREPLMTVIQDLNAFQRIAAESGDSALGLLGGLSGLAGDFKLTRSRVENLAGLSGSLHFAVAGGNGFAFCVHFGSGPVPEDPDTSIQVTDDVYDDLRQGRLDPQNAFMEGKIEVSGDLQIAMQLALAALSPE